VVLAVRTALQEVGHVEGLLPPQERAAIDEALARADAAMGPDGLPPGTQPHKAINAVREALEHVSEPFARRRMERALRAGMAGKSLAEIEAALADERDLDARRGSHDPERTTPQ
jgi:molecular chaperone HscA